MSSPGTIPAECLWAVCVSEVSILGTGGVWPVGQDSQASWTLLLPSGSEGRGWREEEGEGREKGRREGGGKESTQVFIGWPTNLGFDALLGHSVIFEL